MPNTREKLIELLNIAQDYGTKNTHEQTSITIECKDNETVADHLIANGATVQEWISVKDRLPEEDERVIVWVGNNQYNDVRKDTDRVHNGKWVRWGGCVTHWTPWNMPQPPKGE